MEVQLRFGRKRVWGYPYEREIDTTNICQLKCPLCHTGLGTIGRQKGVIHFETYSNIVDQIKGYCVWLSLYSWGEPFLNKEISRFVEYAHKARIATLISSNLNKPFTPEMAESLIKSGLDVLIVSLDGTTQEVYQVYRVGGKLDRVLDNIRLLTEKKKELGSTTPYIEWQFIVMRQNEHPILEARVMAKDLGVDNIVFKKVDFPHGEEDTETARRWMPTVSLDFQREEPFDKSYGETGRRCWRLWRSAVVNWDGGYAPCCYLTDASQDFGSVKTHSIKEIWNNQHYISARGLFEGKEEPLISVGCVTCNVYLESEAERRRNGTLKVHSNGTGPEAFGHGPDVVRKEVGSSKTGFLQGFFITLDCASRP